MPLLDNLLFLRSWISDPLRVAAIAPSSNALADLITSEITPGCAPIVELGPGTGVFTRALLARGVSEREITLVENDPTFADMLQTRFPAATVVCGDASKLRRLQFCDSAGAGAFVSGLPLLSMPPAKVLAILSWAFQRMRTGGRFYQFTYGPRCPVPNSILQRLNLRARRIGGTLANLPPASVYQLTPAQSDYRKRV
jgi:phosphatidylethanolamine/phosphatidyl-N-methylethanolamine N-methyltransferase